MELSHILPSCLTENVSRQRGAPIICIYRELSRVSVKFCICTWFAPNFPQVQYGGEELTEKGSKFAISKWTNTGFPNEQIHFSKPTNKSVETFPNEFPSPRQHLLHPGTMGKSHTQHPNIRQLPIAPQVQKTLIFTETSKWNVPQFSFLQGQLYIHVMKLNNSLKNSRWGLLGLIFSGAMYVVSFCKKFGILQPCPQCPGQYLASWHSHCEYGVVLVLPLLSLISGILGQDRSTTSAVGRLSG